MNGTRAERAVASAGAFNRAIRPGTRLRERFRRASMSMSRCYAHGATAARPECGRGKRQAGAWP